MIYLSSWQNMEYNGMFTDKNVRNFNFFKKKQALKRLLKYFSHLPFE